jgi:hypothetical protein
MSINLDPVIEQAIREAVSANHQPEALGDKIVAWFTALSNGKEDIGDREQTLTRLETLRHAVHLPDDLEEVGP